MCEEVIQKSQKQNNIESTAYHQKKPDLNHWLSCTQHTKQNKQRNKHFKWAIQFLAIASRMEDKWSKKNGPYQFTKDI